MITMPYQMSLNVRVIDSKIMHAKDNFETRSVEYG